MMKKNIIFITVLCIAISLIIAGESNAIFKGSSKSKVVGEAFGKPVREDEFNYYFKTATMFTRSGKDAPNEEEVRQEAWQNLIFRYEAEKLNISVTKKEVQEDLKRLLAEKGVEYGTNNYEIWARMQFQEEPEIFENRIEDLLIISKFMKAKTGSGVSVTEEEMKQKFLNQYNSFESEYIRFESRQEAAEFLKKVKRNKKLWVDTFSKKKQEGQKYAAWINIMSLEALIDLWKIPKEDAYRILNSREGDFILAKNYYGDVVLRLLYTRKADLKQYDDKRKEYYRKMLTMVKKRQGAKDYFEELFKRANYRDYVQEEKRAKMTEELKEASIVVLKTNRGIIEVKLFPNVAPKTCENFIGLVKKGYYDGIIFHRVIKDFMIQGGDPTGTGRGGESIWGRPFEDEVTDEVLFDRPGLLAMANSGPNTNGSQFFITTKPTPWLNKKHTIFGEVVAGYKVVQEIENVPIDSSSKPKKEQKITKAYIKGSEENK